MVNKRGNEMTDGTRVTEQELRRAMQQVVMHAHAPQNSERRLTKEELMKNIDILEAAWRDVDWTVYYP
jgi:hypothetical protein